MNTSYLLNLFASVFLIAEAPKDDPAKTDLEKLQGTWTIMSMHDEGKPVFEMKGKKIKFVGDKFVMLVSDNQEIKTPFKLDPSKKPREIDLIPDQAPKDQPTHPGIYEIDGDNLKIAMAITKGSTATDSNGKVIKEEITRGERPKAFEGKLVGVLVLKRGDIVVKVDDAELKKEEVKHKKNDEKFKKLIVGKWKVRSVSPSFVDIHENEFTADGKILGRTAKNERGVIATYTIEGECILATNVLRDINGKGKDSKWKAAIERLTETEFVTEYFKMERIKSPDVKK